MRRKILTRIMSVLLAGALIMGMAACGTDEGKNPDPTPTQAASQGESKDNTNEPAPTEKPAEVVKINYPLENATPLTLWFASGLGFNAGNGDQVPFTQILEKNTGVKVDWQKPVSGSNASQAYNLLLTEEKLPNVIYYDIKPSEAELLIQDSIIYDLTEYMPKYAPDYWNFLNSHESLLRNVKTESGKVYAFNSLDEEAFNATYVGPVVRKDWLDACGLDVPVTLEDWEKVLVAFKEKYGVALGFSVTRFLDQAALASGTGAYATMNPTLYVDSNGKIQLAQAQPEWKAYMEVLNRWYEKGLIDKDSLTMDDKAVRTKAANNEIGICVTAMSQLTLFVTDAEANGSGAEWIGIEYPRTAAGKATCMIQQDILYLNSKCAVITTSCSEEELITALKFLNYGYTEEGMLCWNFGEEGVSFTLDANGEPQWTDLIKNDEAGLTKASKQYAAAHSAGLTIQLAALVKSINSEQAANAVYEWIENTEAEKHIMPRLALTEDESADYSDIMTAINARISEMCMKYIMGDESLDNFDAFVKELKGMGLDDALAIQQKAYDRWLKN